jgi:hypothetical protein
MDKWIVEEKVEPQAVILGRMPVNPPGFLFPGDNFSPRSHQTTMRVRDQIAQLLFQSLW